MSSDEMHPNLLTVVPGNINIENFVPGRVYKETLMIYNTCNVPIVLNLKSSDKNKLTISESKMRIGVNQSKKLDLIIQDKLNYKYAKTPIKRKKLFIHMKGDLIDEKYEINLVYYQKNNINNAKLNNQNLMNNLKKDFSNKNVLNNQYNQMYTGYLSENPNNHLNYESINDANDANDNIYENKFFNNYKNPFPNNNSYGINQNSFMPIGQNDNEEIINLKNIINDLLNKINNLTALLDKSKMNTYFNKSQLQISNNSFFIFGNYYKKEIKNKYNIDENIDNKRIISRNKILELENTTLLYRIKCLEKKLSLYENTKDEPHILEKNYNSKLNNNDIEKIELDENNIFNKEIKPYYKDNYNKMNLNNNYLINNIYSKKDIKNNNNIIQEPKNVDSLNNKY
jgi:hypothetical protein